MVNRPDQNFNNPAAWTDTFAYDENGNRTSLNENGAVRTYQANALNQYTSASGDTLSFTDGRGNQTSWNGWTYTYDAENRMTGAQITGVTLAFAYDPSGRLVKVTKNGTAEYRYYDGSQYFLRTSAAGALVDWTIWGPSSDEVLARNDPANGGWQYYHQDMINSVFAVTNSSAGVIERYLYDPFGEPDIRDGSWNARTSTAIGNSWLYTGQEWRNDINLSNYKSRWYHPGLGRFLQTDPSRFGGGDINLYRYVRNGVTNFIDPIGLSTSDSLAVSPSEEDKPPGPQSVEGKEPTVEGEFAEKTVIMEPVRVTESRGSGSRAGSIMAGTLAISGVLVADDVTGIGVVNDPAIPVVLVAGTAIAGGVWVYDNARKSGKEKADDVPSWARGKKPLPGEDGKRFAERVMKEQYPPGHPKLADRGPGSEFSQIKKFGDRSR